MHSQFRWEASGLAKRTAPTTPRGTFRFTPGSPVRSPKQMSIAEATTAPWAIEGPLQDRKLMTRFLPRMKNHLSAHSSDWNSPRDRTLHHTIPQSQYADMVRHSTSSPLFVVTLTTVRSQIALSSRVLSPKVAHPSEFPVPERKEQDRTWPKKQASCTPSELVAPRHSYGDWFS